MKRLHRYWVVKGIDLNPYRSKRGPKKTATMAGRAVSGAEVACACAAAAKPCASCLAEMDAAYPVPSQYQSASPTWEKLKQEGVTGSIVWHETREVT